MIYFDSSALMKLVVREPESQALREFLRGQGKVPQVSSLLAMTEIHRGLLRIEAAADIRQQAAEVLDGLVLLPVGRPVLEHASLVPGRHLGSLDAIHLASAQRLRSALTAFVSYDRRLCAAAREGGLPTEAPT